MSVVKSKQSLGELAAGKKARDLLGYVLAVTRGNWQKDGTDAETLKRNADAVWFADKARETALDIIAAIDEANTTSLENEYEARLYLMNHALTLIGRMVVIITTLYEKKIIKKHRVQAWSAQIREVRDAVTAWRRSDKVRRESWGVR